MTLDEWTSGARRRYINVNLHTENKFWNLGLVKIRGSCTAEACHDMFKEKLSQFDLVTNVFGIVTDGAAVMKKFGRLSKRQNQLCLAHGLHLAVADILY